jgi:hypothetical protein
MRPVNAQNLAASAYRTLGLSASATQAQIDSAARRLRIWPDPNSVPPTPWDSPWLGPVIRGKQDIEQALSALNEPSTRVEERLLWFHGNDPSLWSGEDAESLDQTLRTLSAAKDPASVHDFALARLQLALLHDDQFLDASRWKRVLARLGALAQSDDYLAWLLQLEERGDFEKRAQIEEVSAAMKGLPQSLANTLASRAESALEDDDPQTAGRILSLLHTDGGGLLTTGDVQERILNRLEDLVNRRCNHLHEDLDRKFARGGISREIGQAVCGGCAKFYNDSIDPVLTELFSLAGSKSDRTLRGRTAAARAMAHMGQCWAACARYAIAEQTLEAALQLGEGTPVEAAIRAAMARCQENGRRTPVATRHPSTGNQTRYKTVYNNNSTGKSRGGWGGAAIIISIILAASRAFLGINSSSSSSNYNAPSYNYPRYSPQNLTLPNAPGDQTIPDNSAPPPQDPFPRLHERLQPTAPSPPPLPSFAPAGGRSSGHH